MTTVAPSRFTSCFTNARGFPSVPHPFSLNLNNKEPITNPSLRTLEDYEGE